MAGGEEVRMHKGKTVYKETSSVAERGLQLRNQGGPSARTAGASTVRSLRQGSDQRELRQSEGWDGRGREGDSAFGEITGRLEGKAQALKGIFHLILRYFTSLLS